MENVNALISSGKAENFQLAYHLAMGMGDADYVVDVLTRICVEKIVHTQARLNEWANGHGIHVSHGYVLYAERLRKDGGAGMDQSIADYFEQLVMHIQDGDSEIEDECDLLNMVKVTEWGPRKPNQ